MLDEELLANSNGVTRSQIGTSFVSHLDIDLDPQLEEIDNDQCRSF